ncbi:MAG: hypothetical protein ABR550_06675, partial [Wenzhouxiangellaceae bacterium]
RSSPAWLAYALAGFAATGLGWRSIRQQHRRRQQLRRVLDQRAMADQQRRLLSRLYRSLDPCELAAILAESVRELTGREVSCFGYCHPEFPRRLWICGGPELDRDAFDQALELPESGDVVRLEFERCLMAAVWLPGLDLSSDSAIRSRLELFAQTTG